MPLNKSGSKASIGENISTLRHEGRKESQSVAIALDIARRAKRAAGGSVPHVGSIHSAVGGRTDHLALDVPAGSYVIPADIVSGLGQGNTQAGLKILERMFPAPAVKGKTTPIMAAGGEYVIPPEEVVRVGGGDMDKGHGILDAFVKAERKKLVKTLVKLPGPSR